MEDKVSRENSFGMTMSLPGGGLECELMEIKQRSITDRTHILDQSSHVKAPDKGRGAVEGGIRQTWVKP